MDGQSVKFLMPGDEVYWVDPDEDKCSRYLTIRNIKINGEVVSIEEVDGSVVECFAHELI